MKLLKFQDEFDRERIAYDVVFPSPLPADQVQAFYTALASSIPRSVLVPLEGRHSIAVEAWALATGISYRILLPWQIAEHVTSELRHIIPGTIIDEASERDHLAWDDIVEVGLSDKQRTISSGDPSLIATDILATLSQALKEGERAVVQWIIAPVGHENPPSREAVLTSSRHGIWSSLLNVEASKEEVEDRRVKLSLPRYHVVGRIAARTSTPAGARRVVDTLLSALRTSNGAAHFKAHELHLEAGRDQVNFARTPLVFPATLNAAELTAISGFPLGSPSVPGLPRQTSRHLFATADVSKVGRIFGISNYPGNKRPVAQSYTVPTHTYVGGMTGTGKSVLLANAARQDMATGHGVIIIDASNSNSKETLFHRALDYIPRERLNDAIIMDVAASTDRPVAFNLLDQGNPMMVIDQLASLMKQLYPDSQDVWTRELIYHGMYALVDYGNASIIDLLSLIRPRPEELPWVKAVIKSVTNPHVKAFFSEWDNFTPEEKRKRSQPLYDRLWQLNNRPEIHNILGQSKSAFSVKDVLENNRLLFINLAGLPEDTASLLGTLIFQALWTEAQNLTPKRENFIYLDEVQAMTKIDVNLADMMARGRKHKFFLTTSTQHITEKLSEAARMAIVNNAGTKILFTMPGSKEARFWVPEFGGRLVADTDIMGLRRFDAIAQIATEKGPGEPVTFTASPPATPLGTADRAVSVSGNKYGTPVDQVQEDIDARRMIEPEAAPPVGAMGRRKLNQRHTE